MVKGLLAATLLSSVLAGPVLAAATGPVAADSDAKT